MRVQVECYAGYRAEERPLRFRLRERRFEIEDVLDRWYSPGATYFRVQADDGDVYVLRHAEDVQSDTWTLEAFRKVSDPCPAAGVR